MVSPKKVKRKEKIAYAVLHNIRSTYNVGAIFRTAEAAGFSKIFLTGYTPSPVDRLGNLNKQFQKTALGAENFISWETASSLPAVIKKLKTARFHIMALEQHVKAVPLSVAQTKFPAALVLGNEVRGLSRSVLKYVDAILEIPMRGRKESLNVSVAFGIAAYKLLE